MNFKIVINEDQEFYKKISQAVVDNDGYCPCLLEKSADTKCMCKPFLEQDTEGFCHCKRFKKVAKEEV